MIGIETSKRLGSRLTTHDYRHVAISIGREVVGDAFARGYQERMDENIEEEEEQDEDALEVSAGRGGEIGANRYGVPMDVIQYLSNRTIDTFRPLSMKWHSFLELKSSTGTAQKRAAHERSSSVVEEGDRQYGERRSAVSAHNGILSQLQSITMQYQRSCERLDIQVRWDVRAIGSLERAVHTISRGFPHWHIVSLRRREEHHSSYHRSATSR